MLIFARLRLLALVAIVIPAAALVGGMVPAPPEPRPALAGPGIRAVPTRATIVCREFNGTVRRALPTPEQAALAELVLDDQTSQRVRTLLAARQRALEDFVVNNLELLTQLGNTTDADTVDRLTLLWTAFRQLAPVWSRGTLALQIAEVLPPGPRARFERLLAEYWTAVVSEREGERMALHDPQAWPLRLEESVLSLGREVEAAFHSAESSGYLAFTFLTRELPIDEAKRSQLRSMIEDFMADYGSEATDAQKALLVAGVALSLEGPARLQFLERVRSLGK